MADANCSEPPEDSSAERITIPPATELFPDTYDHTIDATVIYICILSSTQRTLNDNFSTYAADITKALKICGYTNTQVKTKRFNNKQDLEEFLGPHLRTMDFFQCAAVLLFWLGATDKDGSNGMIALCNHSFDIRDFWKPFVEVEDLKGKPKINMFFTSLPRKQEDSIQSDSCPLPPKPVDPYETPKEADILIIYQKTDLNKQVDEPASYANAFANNMIKFGQQYHISNLATINTIRNPVSQCYPIVVSTLTRKFFVQPSQHRGIHLELHKLTKDIQLHLDNMLQGGNKRRIKRASAASTAPSTPRYGSKEALYPDSDLRPIDIPVKSTTPVQTPPDRPRPRLPSQSKSKPQWKY